MRITPQWRLEVSIIFFFRLSVTSHKLSPLGIVAQRVGLFFSSSSLTIIIIWLRFNWDLLKSTEWKKPCSWKSNMLAEYSPGEKIRQVLLERTNEGRNGNGIKATQWTLRQQENVLVKGIRREKKRLWHVSRRRSAMSSSLNCSYESYCCNTQG